MRAIAALMVVIFHSAEKGGQYSYDPLSWFTVGNAGVDLFFIISGFIMCHTVDKKDVDFIRFIKSRLHRIIPIYWLLTSFALVVFLIAPEKVNSSGGNTNIFTSYFLLPTEDKYLIQNGWTLRFEFLFYLIFAISLSIKAAYKYLVPMGIIFGLVSLGGLFPPTTYLSQFFLSPMLLEFTFGIAAFYLFHNRTVKVGPRFGVLLILTSVTLIVLVSHYKLENYRVIVYGIPALFFFLGMLAMEPAIIENKSNMLLRMLKQIGDSSYSLYLFHPFALVGCSIILSKMGLNQFGYLFVILLVVCSVISGHLCYLYMEKPLARLTRMNKKPKMPLTTTT